MKKLNAAARDGAERGKELRNGISFGTRERMSSGQDPAQFIFQLVKGESPKLFLLLGRNNKHTTANVCFKWARVYSKLTVELGHAVHVVSLCFQRAIDVWQYVARESLHEGSERVRDSEMSMH